MFGTKSLFLIKIVLLCQILQVAIALQSNKTEIPSTQKEAHLKNQSGNKSEAMPQEYFRSYFNSWMVEQWKEWKASHHTFQWKDQFAREVGSFLGYLEWMGDPTSKKLIAKMRGETNETIGELVGELGEEKGISLFGYLLTFPYEDARMKTAENNETMQVGNAPNLNQMLEGLLLLQYDDPSKKTSLESLLRLFANESYQKKVEEERQNISKEINDEGFQNRTESAFVEETNKNFALTNSKGTGNATSVTKLEASSNYKMKSIKNKHIEKIKILPQRFSTEELPCHSHKKFVSNKNNDHYKFWKPICNDDGSYSTTDKICRKKRCWCVDEKGMFMKQVPRNSETCLSN